MISYTESYLRPTSEYTSITLSASAETTTYGSSFSTLDTSTSFTISPALGGGTESRYSSSTLSTIGASTSHSISEYTRNNSFTLNFSYSSLSLSLRTLAVRSESRTFYNTIAGAEGERTLSSHLYIELFSTRKTIRSEMAWTINNQSFFSNYFYSEFSSSEVNSNETAEGGSDSIYDTDGNLSTIITASNSLLAYNSSSDSSIGSDTTIQNATGDIINTGFHTSTFNIVTITTTQTNQPYIASVTTTGETSEGVVLSSFTRLGRNIDSRYSGLNFLSKTFTKLTSISSTRSQTGTALSLSVFSTNSYNTFSDNRGKTRSVYIIEENESYIDIRNFINETNVDSIVFFSESSMGPTTLSFDQEMGTRLAVGVNAPGEVTRPRTTAITDSFNLSTVLPSSTSTVNFTGTALRGFQYPTTLTNTATNITTVSSTPFTGNSDSYSASLQNLFLYRTPKTDASIFINEQGIIQTAHIAHVSQFLSNFIYTPIEYNDVSIFNIRAYGTNFSSLNTSNQTITGDNNSITSYSSVAGERNRGRTIMISEPHMWWSSLNILQKSNGSTRVFASGHFLDGRNPINTNANFYRRYTVASPNTTISGFSPPTTFRVFQNVSIAPYFNSLTSLRKGIRSKTLFYYDSLQDVVKSNPFGLFSISSTQESVLGSTIATSLFGSTSNIENISYSFESNATYYSVLPRVLLSQEMANIGGMSYSTSGITGTSSGTVINLVLQPASFLRQSCVEIGGHWAEETDTVGYISFKELLLTYRKNNESPVVLNVTSTTIIPIINSDFYRFSIDTRNPLYFQKLPRANVGAVNLYQGSIS